MSNIESPRLHYWKQKFTIPDLEDFLLHEINSAADKQESNLKKGKDKNKKSKRKGGAEEREKEGTKEEEQGAHKRRQFMKCGRCRARVYCCVEHQHADWPAHKGECVTTS